MIMNVMEALFYCIQLNLLWNFCRNKYILFIVTFFLCILVKIVGRISSPTLYLRPLPHDSYSSEVLSHKSSNVARVLIAFHVKNDPTEFMQPLSWLEPFVRIWPLCYCDVTRVECTFQNVFKIRSDSCTEGHIVAVKANVKFMAHSGLVNKKGTFPHVLNCTLLVRFLVMTKTQRAISHLCVLLCFHGAVLRLIYALRIPEPFMHILRSFCAYFSTFSESLRMRTQTEQTEQ